MAADAAAPPRARRERRPTSSAATCTATTCSSTRALRVFPPAFVVRPPSGPAGADWVRANIDFALAQADASPLGPDAITTRLPEMLLVEVLRLHLATAPARRPRLAGGPARPGAQPRARRAARGAGAEVDGRRPGPRRGGVAVAARRAVPAGARALADPLPHRVADAPRRGPAGLDGPRRRRRSPAGSATTRRRRSAAPSSECTASHPQPGVRPTASADPAPRRRALALHPEPRGAGDPAERPLSGTSSARDPRPARNRGACRRGWTWVSEVGVEHRLPPGIQQSLRRKGSDRCRVAAAAALRRRVHRTDAANPRHRGLEAGQAHRLAVIFPEKVRPVGRARARRRDRPGPGRRASPRPGKRATTTRAGRDRLRRRSDPDPGR